MVSYRRTPRLLAVDKWWTKRETAIPKNEVHRTPKRLITFHAGHVQTRGPQGGKDGVFNYRCHAFQAFVRQPGGWMETGKHESSSLLDFWRALHAILRAKETTWILCHNVAWQWTLCDGWNALCSGEWKLGPCVVEDLPVIVRAKRDGKRIRLLDLRNYWNAPLPDLMASVGIHDGCLPTDKSPDLVWLQWCADRAKAIAKLFTALVDLWDKEGNGNFGSTAAGCAWACYRHRFMDHEIRVHVNEKATRLERDSYHGGTVDCYYLGHTPKRTFKLDMQSAYAWAMATRDYPTRLERYDEDLQGGNCEIQGDPANAIAEVVVETYERPLPLLWRGTFLEALGTFRACLAGDELREAHAAGLVRGVYRLAEYRVQPLFDRYVDHWFAHKTQAAEQGELPRAAIAKAFLTSLYGKWAQRYAVWELAECRPRERPFDYWSEIDGRTQEATLFRLLANRSERMVGVKEWTYSFPAISSFITARVRDRMRWLRGIAGRRHVFAQVTDCLYVDVHGLRNLDRQGLIRTGQLGALKVERVNDGLEVKGVGSLWHGEERHVAGLSYDALPVGDGSYLQHSGQGVRAILGGKALDQVTLKATLFKPSCTYDKGYRLKGGWTAPYVFDGGKIVERVQ